MPARDAAAEMRAIACQQLTTSSYSSTENESAGREWARPASQKEKAMNHHRSLLPLIMVILRVVVKIIIKKR